MKLRAAVVLGLLAAATAAAQSDFGGLYIAGGGGFSFKQAVQNGLAENHGRFFVISLPPETAGLSQGASADVADVRGRGARAGAVFLVCQRDVDSGAVVLSNLVTGVVPVRGWPPLGRPGLPPDRLLYPDEDPKNFPTSVALLRRLRAICS
jgi:hypothetical protein